VSAPAHPSVLRLHDRCSAGRHHRVADVPGPAARDRDRAPRSPASRPRIHDARHTFAVATLLGWYRDGADVQARLPLLSTYLGHTDPRHTCGYLSAAPQLLALAADRMERYPGATS